MSAAITESPQRVERRPFPVAPPRHRVLTVARWPVGGIRTYIHYVYPTLYQAGYRFTFAGPADERFDAFRQELRHWPDAAFIEIPCESPLAAGRTLRRLLRSGRFDVVHSQGVTSAIHTCLANLGVGVPHLVTSHDVFRPNQFAGWTGRLKRRVMAELLRRAETIVNVSHDAEQNLIEYLPRVRASRCRLVTIHNGIDVERFNPALHERAGWLRRQLSLDDDTALFGFLGRFMEQKGFLPLLDALERLPQRGWHLVAIGSGDMIREYQAETNRRGLNDRVTFVDFIPQVERVLPELDALVMPSLWEACPLLPMEALALGVPVIGFDCLGLREVLRDTPSDVVPTGDTTALAGAMRKRMARPQRDAALAYADEARRRFDSSRCAARLVDEFERTLQATGATR